MARRRLRTAATPGRRALAALGLRPPVVEVPPQGLVLHDVNVVNPGLGRKERQRLTVEGSTITDISNFEPLHSEEDEERRYAGAYALPGLIDMHVNFPVLPSRWIPATFDAAEGAALLYLGYR